MALNPGAVGASSEPKEISWGPKDCALYALGVGAGVDELQFTTENTRDVPQLTLPTMPVILGGDVRVLEQAGGIDWAKLLHAEQRVEVLMPLPVKGAGVTTTRIVEIWDKGKGALIVTETTGNAAASGEAMFRTRAGFFVRGAGGWGGERGPSSRQVDPQGPPDLSVQYQSGEDQALLYRLSGDRNPLHSDPAFAKKAGFDRPILHGLCTYGFAGRAVVHAAAGGDPHRVRSIAARFASPVYPGQALTFDLWIRGRDVHFSARTEGGERVLTHGSAELSR